MANGFLLHLFEQDGVEMGAQRFAALPIRIGRSSLNDFQVTHKLVSEFHARIEEVEGKLCVRDLSSKNGVFVHVPGKDAPVALAAQTPCQLEPHGFEFRLSPALRVRVESVSDQQPEDRRSQAKGSVLGNAKLLAISANASAQEDAFTASFVLSRGAAAPAAPPLAVPVARPPASLTPPVAEVLGRSSRELPVPPAAAPAAPSVGAASVPALAPIRATPPLILAEHAPKLSPLPFRAAETRVDGTNGQASGPVMPVAARTVVLGSAALPTLEATAWDPIVPARPGGAGPSARSGPSASPAALPAPESLEGLALRGLREIAGSLLPGQPLDTEQDLARFITKLHDAMETFCRCFIPLREGCSRFVPAPELERAALERSRRRSSAYVGVERAHEPRHVAAALLDWREPAQDAVLAVENICADLVFQQVNLQQGALEGTQALLAELSPQRIDQESEESRGRGALALFSSRYRGLWEEYAARHQDFQAARERFAEVFGPEFTRAYRRYWDRGGSTDDSTE